MAHSLLRRLRRAIGLVWAILLLGLLCLVAVNTLAPSLGYQIFVIRGGSMSPTIPLGSIVAVEHVDTNTLAVGDTITIQTTTGVVYTHRIVAVDTTGPERQFQVRGDANATPDAAMVPAAGVIGRVSAYAPVLGYLIAMLSMPSGLVCILSLLASLLLAYWMIEDLEREARGEPEGRSSGNAGGVPA